VKWSGASSVVQAPAAIGNQLSLARIIRDAIGDVPTTRRKAA
jgi:hypothetical protein